MTAEERKEPRLGTARGNPPDDHEHPEHPEHPEPPKPPHRPDVPPDVRPGRKYGLG